MLSHWKAIAAAFAVVLGIVSGVFSLAGVTTTWSVAGLLCAVCLFVVVAYFAFIGRVSIRFVTLEQGLRQYGKSATSLRAVFSAADQMRQLAEAGLFDRQPHVLPPGSRVRLITRKRASAPEQRLVDERVVRLERRLAPRGISVESRSVKWDYFMVGGVVFDDELALVKFYVRSNGSTRALHEKYVLARKGKRFEELLFHSLADAFDAMW